MVRLGLAILALVLAGSPVLAEAPERYRRAKARSAMEVLGQEAASLPTSRSTSRPTTQRGDASNPFGKTPTRPDYALPGVVIYSNGTKLPGYLWTPSGKAFRVYELTSKQFRDIPFDVVKRIDGLVAWARMEDDWRWKEGGSDVKVYTGKKYPNRMTTYRFTLLDDRTITGQIAQMFFVELAGKVGRAVLHKRHQGKIGQTLERMPYVKAVIFDPRAMREAIEEATSSRPRDASKRRNVDTSTGRKRPTGTRPKHPRD